MFVSSFRNVIVSSDALGLGASVVICIILCVVGLLIVIILLVSDIICKYLSTHVVFYSIISQKTAGLQVLSFGLSFSQSTSRRKRIGTLQISSFQDKRSNLALSVSHSRQAIIGGTLSKGCKQRKTQRNQMFYSSDYFYPSSCSSDLGEWTPFRLIGML